MDSLGDLAGTQSKSSIARRLGRSYWAVKAQCAKHNISARVTSGYSRADLEYLLGVGSRSVRKWIQLGWLKIQQDRINEPGMIKFLREHPEEYRLNRVDETWFKGLLFPSLAGTTFQQLTTAEGNLHPTRQRKHQWFGHPPISSMEEILSCSRNS